MDDPSKTEILFTQNNDFLSIFIQILFTYHLNFRDVFVFGHLKQREIRDDDLSFGFGIAEPTYFPDQLGLLDHIKISALSPESIFLVSVLYLRFYLFCAFDLVLNVADEVVEEHQLCGIACVMVFAMNFNFGFLI